MLTKMKRGFSLVEILVAIAILLILAMMLLGVIGSFRSQAKNVTCANNLHQIALAMQNYATDNRNLLPTAENSAPVPVPLWGNLIRPYLSTEATFICPSDSNPTSIALFNSSNSLSNQATFSNALIKNGTITFRRMRSSYENTSDGHQLSIYMSIPRLAYISNVYTGTTGWALGTTKTITPGADFMASEVQIFIGSGAAVGHSGWTWYSHPFYNAYFLDTKVNSPQKTNPYTNALPSGSSAAWYVCWGVVLDANSIAYAYSMGKDESWWGPPTDPLPLPPWDPDGRENWLRERGAPNPPLRGPTDFGFVVTIKGSNTSGTYASDSIAVRNSDVRFKTSYAYNAQLSNLKRETVSADYAVALDYSDAVCKPTLNPVSMLDPAVRHTGKRLNLLRMDGRVESVSLPTILTNSGTTFTPSVWIP
jgi:prepilin-type N-terminal cleavage/methylation domain-containing protein